MPGNFAAKISNRILFALLRAGSRQFWRNTTTVKEVQEAYLLSLMNDNAQTMFGKEKNFAIINSVEAFQKTVPLSCYDDYKYYLELIATGRKNILTHEPVTKFALSSGSTSASKLIPTTKRLQLEFDRCINVWLYDLYRRYPGLLNGKAFWIITPSISEKVDRAKIKAGFDDDSDYFSPVKRWFIRKIFAVPDEIPKLCKGNNYYFMLGVFLLKEKNLRLVSVWNPSVLIILLDKIKGLCHEIIEVIETGKLRLPEEQDNKSILAGLLKPDKHRARKLKEIFGMNLPDSALWKAVWPNLTLISAWDSAWARYPAQNLQKLFPEVAFQGKGLLATEACVSFPAFRGSKDYNFIPAYFSHFFEFQKVDTGEIQLLHELTPGETYEVIVTTGGGFYRYRLFDLVTCSGYYLGLPELEFAGKTDLISDITGEKLHEAHVQQVLNDIFDELGIIPGMHFLAPKQIQGQYGYCLYLQSHTPVDIAKLLALLEAGLCTNFHYQHCRNLEQLLPVSLKILNDDEVLEISSAFTKDKKLGTVKFSVLRKELGLDI